MLLVVGLGNPGTRYNSTRHNVGFRFIDLMAKKAEIRLNDRRAKAVLGQGRIAQHDVVLAKPRTFMNNSGKNGAYNSHFSNWAYAPQIVLWQTQRVVNLLTPRQYRNP